MSQIYQAKIKLWKTQDTSHDVKSFVIALFLERLLLK